MLLVPIIGWSPASSIVPFDVAWTDNDFSGTNTTSYSFTGADFGAADSTRFIHVAITHNKAANSTLSSATIGGVSATIITGTPSGNWAACTHIYAAVPSGASGTVALTFSGNQDWVCIDVYRVVGTTKTPPASSSTVEASSTSVSTSVTRVTGAWMIGNTYAANGNAITWTNLTEDSDVVPASGYRASSAAILNAASGSQSITAAGSGSAGRRIFVTQWLPT